MKIDARHLLVREKGFQLTKRRIVRMLPLAFALAMLLGVTAYEMCIRDSHWNSLLMLLDLSVLYDGAGKMSKESRKILWK